MKPKVFRWEYFVLLFVSNELLVMLIQTTPLSGGVRGLKSPCLSHLDHLAKLQSKKYACKRIFFI